MTIEAASVLAKHLFDTYNGSGKRRWETFDGRPVPPWEDLSEDVRAKWVNAATEALELLAPWRTSRLSDLVRAAIDGLESFAGNERPVIRLTVGEAEWAEALSFGPVFRDNETGRPAVRYYGVRKTSARSAYWGAEADSRPPQEPAVEPVEVLLLYPGPGGGRL